MNQSPGHPRRCCPRSPLGAPAGQERSRRRPRRGAGHKQGGGAGRRADLTNGRGGRSGSAGALPNGRAGQGEEGGAERSCSGRGGAEGLSPVATVGIRTLMTSRKGRGFSPPRPSHCLRFPPPVCYHIWGRARSPPGRSHFQPGAPTPSRPHLSVVSPPPHSVPIIPATPWASHPSHTPPRPAQHLGCCGGGGYNKAALTAHHHSASSSCRLPHFCSLLCSPLNTQLTPHKNKQLDGDTASPTAARAVL